MLNHFMPDGEPSSAAIAGYFAMNEKPFFPLG
jgi:hypothetical protein